MEKLSLPGLEPMPAGAALVDPHVGAVDTLGEIAQLVAELRGAAHAQELNGSLKMGCRR